MALLSDHSQFAFAPSYPVAKIKKLRTKLKILSLGGCVTNFICERLESVASHQHLWRVTVPSFMSPAVEGRNLFHADQPGTAERLNYELSKQAMFRAQAFAPDILVVDPTSDFPNDYYEKDGCIIPDISSNLLSGEAKWSWPSDFRLSEWRCIKPRSMEYVELYVDHLRSLIDLAKQNGTSVLFIRRKLCLQTVRAEGVTVIADPELADFNWWIDVLWSEIEAAQLPITILNLDERLLFTSPDAPIGEWAFHPVEELYDFAIFKMAQILQLNEKLLVNILGDIYLERVKRRQSVLAEHKQLAAAVEALSTANKGYESALQSFGKDRDAYARRHGELATIVESLQAERDALALNKTIDRTALGEAQTAAANAAMEVERLTALIDTITADQQVSDATARRLEGERDQLAAQRDDLTSHLDALEVERARLVAERDQAAAQSGSLSAERDTLAAQLPGIAAECDALKASMLQIVEERAALAAEHEGLAMQISGLAAERNMLNVTLAAVTAEREELAAKIPGIADERDSLRALLAAITVERDSIAAEKVALVDALAAQSDAVQLLTAERDALRVEREALAADRARLTALVNELTAIPVAPAPKGRLRRLLGR